MDKAEERAARDEFFTGAAELTPVVGVETKGGTFLLSTRDHVVGRNVFVKGAPGEARALRLALRLLDGLGLRDRLSGGTFLEIGANVGTTCITALLRYRFGRAIAVEPAPGNLSLLRANLALNDLTEKVDVVAAAVSDRRGEATLHLSTENFGDHRLAVNGVRTQGHEQGLTTTVPTTTLDELEPVRGLRAESTLAWLDVQGFEGHVLAGGRRFFSAAPALVLELWPAALAASGRLDDLQATLRDTYTHFADLRGKEPALQPVSELAALVAETGERHTDLLMVRR